MTVIDRTKWALVTNHSLTVSGFPEIVATAEIQADLKVFAKNVYGSRWRRDYKIVKTKDLSQPVMRR
jgi:hypothetical protein